MLEKGVMEGKWPDGFYKWSKPWDQHGTTVAHMSAMNGTLPNNDVALAVKNNRGQTAAYIMASSAPFGEMPEGFEWYDLENDDGNTVAHAMVHFVTLPIECYNIRNKITNELVAQNAIAIDTLPSEFCQWDQTITVTDLDYGVESMTLAHWLVVNGSKSFDEIVNKWGNYILLLTDGSGRSVLEYFLRYHKKLPVGIEDRLLNAPTNPHIDSYNEV